MRERKRHLPSLAVFLLLGIGGFFWGLWLISQLPKEMREVEKYWAMTLQGLAFTLGTVAIVSLVWKFLGGDPVDEALTDLEAVSDKTKAAVVDLKENIDALKTAQDDVIKSVALLADSRKSGVERVHAYSTNLAKQEEWMRRLISAQEHIELMGYTLLVLVWTKGVNFEHELAERVRHGVRVRVLIMHEENKQLIAVLNAKIPGAILLQTQAEISGMRGSMKHVATLLREGSKPVGSFEFRTLKEGTILMQLCRIDARLTAVQYLYSVIASQSPLLEVNGKNSELFNVYTKEFETLWKSGTPVEEVPPKPVPSSDAH